MAMWQPTAEDVQRIFDEQNPWHRGGGVPEILAPPIERALARRLWSILMPDGSRRAQLIVGPRRVGKTTVMYQTVRHLIGRGLDPTGLWWIRLDHPLLLPVDLGTLVRSVLGRLEPLPDGREVILFLDELVYARDWDLWLKTFHDERWPVRVLATSSATAALRRRRLESGVGRWTERMLTPCLFGEFLDLMGAAARLDVGDTLAETLAAIPRSLPNAADVEMLRTAFQLVGGFPELIVGIRGEAVPDDRSLLLHSQQVLRNDAVERAVYKDIPQSFGVENPLMLERVLYVLASQCGGVLSPTRISSELGLTQPTLDRYLSYLEHAFLVFTLPNYSGRETAIQRRGRKLYFVDGAVRNAALHRGLAPLGNPPELGLLMENLAATTLHALALHTGTRLFHWRDGQHEVDLVLDHPTGPLAFEIATSTTHSSTGLTAFVDRHPRFAGRCYVVAPNAPVIHPSESSKGLGRLPLDLFLVAVSRQAEAALDATFG